MDVQLASTVTVVGQNTTWDYVVVDGIVPMITGVQEAQQEAQIAGFLQVGGCPQLPTVGVPWTQYLTGGLPFTAVDGAIRQNLANIGLTNFRPNYTLNNGKIVCSITSA